MKVYLDFIGCKLNLAEMEALGRHLQAAGAELIDVPAEADLCILNSCTVTHTAAGKSRRRVRRLLRRAPQAQIVVTGCHATQFPEDLQRLSPRVRLVDNWRKADLFTLVQPSSPGSAHRPGPPGLRTRAFVKVQDGCDNHCTYCVVRLARGPHRSRPPGSVLQEVERRVAEGYQEVVLTGVHVGAYGQDLGTDLAGLVRLLLERTEVARLRLSSIEPHDLRPAFLDLWDDARLCPHLHLPLQSGCDATLRRMGRRYTAERFHSLVAQARAVIPDLAVTTDVIVGFPGETEEEFAETRAFVESLGFARVHVFPFSARPGTPAAAMPDAVPTARIRQRHQALSAVARAGAAAFARRFLGREMEVLFERCAEPAGEGRCPTWSGLTGNYLRVQVACREPLHNEMRRVRLLALRGEGGRVVGRLA